MLLTVVPGRSEGVLLHTPARRENDKVSDGHSWLCTWAGQHCEDGGILGREGCKMSQTAWDWNRYLTDLGNGHLKPVIAASGCTTLHGSGRKSQIPLPLPPPSHEYKGGCQVSSIILKWGCYEKTSQLCIIFMVIMIKSLLSSLSMLHPKWKK